MGAFLLSFILLVSVNSFANTCDDNLFSDSTLKYYNSHAKEYNETRAHVSPELQAQRDAFLKILKGPKVLEIGAGHGRDALYFKELGLKVVATEPSVELAKIAEEKTGEKVLLLTAQEIEFKNEFDGIWAMASLIHVPASELPATFAKLRDALKEDGVIYASFLKGVGTEDVAERIEDGRFFNRVGEQTLRQIIRKTPGLEIDETLTNGHNNDYFGKLAPSQTFGFFNLVLRKKSK